MAIGLSTVNATTPMFGLGLPQAGGKAPKKYVKVDGVMQLNPEYKRWKEGNGEKATTAANPDKALPVVSNMEEAMEYSQASQDAGEGAVGLSQTTDATVEMMQEPEICAQVGLDADEMVDGLGEIFRKYETPMGLMNKLMCLSEYDEMEFIVDDSGSMGCQSDTKDKMGNWQTRWTEAHVRMKSLVEILAYVPTPKITIRFLNRRDVVTFTRNGEKPEVFQQKLNSQIDAAFRRAPSGGTPARERLQESFSRGSGRRVSRYFFGDGCPNGGKRDQEAITKMVCDRANPEGNPVTFLSCTNEDDQVEWMKEAEEVAPYCAEYDDFSDESDEVRRDQGDVLPYTMGFHLIGQLVGAMNPDDLDAMDESIPFTKFMLESLLGVQTTEPEFRRYFDGFLDAQRSRAIETKMDKVKKNFPWQQHFNSFVSTRLAKNIPIVADFKRQIANA